MPDARVQLTVEIETEGAGELTALRRELDSLGAAGRAAFAPLDASLGAVVNQLRQSRQLVSSLEPVFRNFFQSLLGQARSFRDAFQQLLLDLLQFFLRTVARMVDAWLAGLRLLGGSGGGGLFGGFSFGFPGGTAPTFPSGGSFSLGGGLSSLASALPGLLGGSRRSGPDAVDLQLDAERSMRQAFDAYRNHRLTAPAAIGQIQAILQQAAQALAPLGSRGRGALDVLTQIAANHIANIRRIERRRRQRAAIVAGLPVPEFQFGGLVRGVNAVDGRVLALLHPGEAVLNRRAVETLGAHRVQALNQAAGGAGAPARQLGALSFQNGGLVPATAPLGSATVNIGPIIVQAAGDPRATAESVLREIRRRARDRGLPSPV